MASLESWRSAARAGPQRPGQRGAAGRGARPPRHRPTARRRSRSPTRPSTTSTAIVAQEPDAPHASLALAYLRLGGGARPPERPRRGDGRLPLGGAAGAHRTGGARDLVRRAGQHPARGGRRSARTPDARHAEAFRLSLDGWRQLEREDVPAAADGARRARSRSTRATRWRAIATAACSRPAAMTPGRSCSSS